MRIAAVMDGVAYGVLVGAGGPVEGPITAEAEAERPMRARRALLKEAPGSAQAVDEDDDDVVDEEELAEEAPTEPAAKPAPRKRAPRRVPATDGAQGALAEVALASAGAATTRARSASPDTAPEASEPGVEGSEVDAETGEALAAPPRKRTRRGTRGGRNRKRKISLPDAAATGNGVSEGSDADDASVGSEESDGVPAITSDSDAPRPVIHVPEPGLGRNGDESSSSESAPPRPSTRRGSRGGRNRKRKSPAATASSDAQLAEEPAVSAAPSAGGDEWAYTPMSEWDSD